MHIHVMKTVTALAPRQRRQSKFGCLGLGPIPAQPKVNLGCRFDCRRDSPMLQSSFGTAGIRVLIDVWRVCGCPRFTYNRSKR